MKRSASSQPTNRACSTTDERRELRVIGVLSAMLAVALLLVFLLPPDAAAKKGGNGKGGGGSDPPLPSVRYMLTWLNYGNWHTRALDINDSGIAVGRMWDWNNSSDQRAFVADAGGNVDDLNAVGSALDAVWFDLELDGETTDWFARGAHGINAHGQIVGEAEHSTLNAPTRAFLFDPTLETPTFFLFPGGGSNEYGAALTDEPVYPEDQGPTVVGWSTVTNMTIVYRPSDGYVGVDLGFPSNDGGDINNAGEIVTPAGYLAVPNGTGYDIVDFNEVFSDARLYAINDQGQICGGRDKINGKNGQAGGAIRLDPAGGGFDDTVVYPAGSAGTFAADINDDGDICISGGILYTDSGAVLLDDLLHPDSPTLEGAVYPWAINNPNDITDPEFTGFGQICGLSGDRGFVLTPVQP